MARKVRFKRGPEWEGHVPHGTTHHFDAAREVLIHHHTCCDTFWEHPLDELLFFTDDPSHLSRHCIILFCRPCSLKVYTEANCPLYCGQLGEHHHEESVHLNCNLPADHPHPSATHVRALVAHLRKRRQPIHITDLPALHASLDRHPVVGVIRKKLRARV